MKRLTAFAVTASLSLLGLSSTMAQEQLLRWDADQSGDNFGNPKPLVDTDGDGVCDFVIGGWRLDFSSGLEYVSYHDIISGSTGLVLQRRTPGFNHIYRDFAAVGDVDADGIDDWAHSDASWIDNTGNSVLVFSGATGRLILTLRADDPSDVEDYFGEVLAGGEDVNGDGHADLLVGAPGFDIIFATIPHYFRLYSGIDGSLLFEERATDRSDLVGSALTFLSDLDGDGVAEFAAATGREDGNGRVAVYSGKFQRKMYELSGLLLDSQNVMVGVHDQDGDGLEDLVVTNGGGVDVFSGRDGALLRRISTAFVVKECSPIDDVDGDAVGDLVLGSESSGAILLSGRDLDVLYLYPRPGVNGIGAAGGLDLNQDGAFDFVLGCARHATAYAGSELFLGATPSTLPAGTPFVAKLAGGEPAALAALFIDSINGNPFVFLLGGVVVLDSVGSHSRNLRSPEFAPTGTEVTFVGFALGADGRIESSGRETIRIQ